MKTELLESITKQLTPEMLQHVSTLLGEAPAQTQKAVDRTIPTVLAGLIHLSSSANGPTQLLDLINHDNYGRLLNNLSGLLEQGNTAQILMTAGQDILSTLFAGKLNAVSELIATASGVSSTSASSLLSLTAPVVIGVVERARALQGLNAAGLTKMLIGQKEVVAKLAPAGLAGVLGLSNLANLGVGPAEVATARTPDPVRRVGPDPVKGDSVLKKGLWPVLGIVGVGVIYFLVGRDPEVTRSLMDQWTPTATPAVASVTLPGGAVLSLPEGSFNYDVAKFLGDPAMTTVPKTFVFDRLHFDSGTTRFTPESVQTVEELSAILKAYPAVDVRLDGHTDNVGDTEANKKLSLDQATVVKETLIQSGIGATRLTTAGYGQEYPFASNETEEGRAKNQRLELVVLKK
jgi:outer membrane protein OmpA-like peptidoglycan-associated protein